MRKKRIKTVSALFDVLSWYLAGESKEKHGYPATIAFAPEETPAELITY
jgi:hypothetical protein